MHYFDQRIYIDSILLASFTYLTLLIITNIEISPSPFIVNEKNIYTMDIFALSISLFPIAAYSVPTILIFQKPNLKCVGLKIKLDTGSILKIDHGIYIYIYISI